MATDPCSRAGLPAPAPDGIDSLDASMTGGTFHGKPDAPVSLAAGVTMNLTTDLVVVADKDLVIDGTIMLPWLNSPGDPSVNITLVSLKGNVVIGPNGVVGAGKAAPGESDTLLGQGDDGSDGGLIRLLGVSIDVQGRVIGNMGGDGGDGSTTINLAVFIAAAIRFSGIRWVGRYLTGKLVATAGAGGKGGDVVLCAVDSIHIKDRIEGGQAGGGGTAECHAGSGRKAIANGGASGNGGEIQLRGPSATAKTQVFNDGNLLGGRAGTGRKAIASAHDMGAPGQAEGGRAGKGGTVTYFGTVVATDHFTKAGDGDVTGGDAEARGGKGSNSYFDAGRGGDATATGGQGGRPGDTPQMPMATGLIQQGIAGGHGKGGDAESYAGVGGDSVGFFSSTVGGKSGMATAQGGSNGLGTPPGPPVVSGPALPTGKTGGVTWTARQTGAS